MGVMEKLSSYKNLDKNILWVVLVILVAYPIISPIGIPISIDPMTREFYDYIDELPSGSKVWMSNNVNPGMMGEMAPAFVAIMSHMHELELDIVLFNVYDPTAIPVWVEFMRPELERRGHVGEYGVDWAWMPYIPGKETALASMAADIRYTTKLDYFGTPLDELPIMEGLNNVEDFDMVILIGCTSPYFAYIRQVIAPYQVTFITQVLTIDVPLTMPYYPLQTQAILKGMAGAAEYEKIISEPWRALAAIESTSTSHAWIFVAVITANIYYLYKKYTGGGE